MPPMRLTEDDHLLNDALYPVTQIEDGKITTKEVAALSAINMRLRDDYVKDASGGLKRWNHGHHVDPDGDIISEETWNAKVGDWLPTKEDGAYIQSLMVPCYEPGKFASWISPPRVGIDNKPGDFEYVQLHMA